MAGLWIKEYVYTQNKHENSEKQYKWTLSARRPRPPTDLSDTMQEFRTA